MPTRGGEEQNLLARLVEYRCDGRNIRQMRTTIIRRVEQVNIPRLHVRIGFNDGFHRTIHRTQMHRHMRCIGDKLACRVKHRARKIEPFLDVDGISRLFQRHPHLFGNRHEQIVENLQHHRISRRADRMATGELLGACQNQMLLGGQFALPARFHHGCVMRFNDECRPLDHLPRLQLRAIIDRSGFPSALAENLRFAHRLGNCRCGGK